MPHGIGYSLPNVSLGAKISKIQIKGAHMPLNVTSRKMPSKLVLIFIFLNIINNSSLP